MMNPLDEMRRELRERYDNLKNPMKAEEMEKCRDILKKLRKTDQIYIVDHDVPLSISKGLFNLLDARRRLEAEKRDVPEEQFEFEDIIALLLGFLEVGSNPKMETLRGAESATVYEVDGRYTVHLYGPWAGPRIYTGLKTVSFPALTRWKRIDERTSRAVFPHPTNIRVDIDRGIMGRS